MQQNRARGILGEIPMLLEHGWYNAAVNRAYYAAFHMLKALEVIGSFWFQKAFGRYFLSQGKLYQNRIFPVELSDIIGSLHNLCEKVYLFLFDFWKSLIEYKITWLLKDTI